VAEPTSVLKILNAVSSWITKKIIVKNAAARMPSFVADVKKN
jgi:hypothetical protein